MTQWKTNYESSHDVAEFEIDAPVAHLDLGKAYTATRGQRTRDERNNIPGSLIGLGEIQAGLDEAYDGKLQPARPE